MPDEYRRVSAAGDYFCVEMDQHGTAIVMEAGSLDWVADELKLLLRQIAATQGPHCRFIWADDAQYTLQVTVTAGHGRRIEPTIIVAAQRVYEFPHCLTRRELDVVTLLTTGLSNGDIAQALGMSVRTVTTHVDHVMRKLGGNSRTAVAVAAREEGLLRFPLAGQAELASPRTLDTVLGLRSEQRHRRMRAPVPVRKPLVIGAAFPLSGSAASDGVEMVQGARLAIEELNERGGIDGRSIAMELIDVDILDADSITQSLTHLAAQDADVLTSGYFAHQDVAHEVAAEIGVPYLHATTLQAMETRVREAPDRYGNIFQMCPNDSNYAPRFVDFTTKLRDSKQWLPSSKRLLIIEGAWDLTDFGAAEAHGRAEAQGWKLDVIRLPRSPDTSWKRVAEHVRRTEPAAVMIGHFMVDGTVTFIEEFLSDAPDTLVYLVFAPGAPEFRARLGGRAEGIVWATVTGTYSDSIAHSFVSRYEARYGCRPGRSSAGTAYDRVRVLAQAWSQSNNPRDAASVSAELRRIVHRGVSGAYFFGGEGQTVHTYPGKRADPSLAQAHLIFQIQDGRQRIIGPRLYADGAFRTSPWLRRTLAAAAA